jgi:nitrate reductase gamma subunit
MRENAAIALAAAAYLVILLSIASFVLKARLLWRAAQLSSRASSLEECPSCATAGRATADVLLLLRLLKANDVLWLGEWLFHVSFLFVFMRHLRYVLNPLPACTAFFQPAGIIAGYILPCALVYILVIKLANEKRYILSYNFFLIGVLLLLSTTGILLRTVFRTDVVAVKLYVLGLLKFSPGAVPQGLLFAVHFLLALLLVLCLPTHLLTAPLTLLDARKREEEVEELMHGQQGDPNMQ